MLPSWPNAHPAISTPYHLILLPPHLLTLLPPPPLGTLDELSGLKAALQLEREERIAEDDEIVQVGAGWRAVLSDGKEDMPSFTHYVYTCSYQCYPSIACCNVGHQRLHQGAARRAQARQCLKGGGTAKGGICLEEVLCI